MQADSTAAQQTAPAPEARDGSAAPPAFSELSLQQRQDPGAASEPPQATGEWTACYSQAMLESSGTCTCAITSLWQPSCFPEIAC